MDYSKTAKCEKRRAKTRIPSFPKNKKNQKQKSRHSRAGGNPKTQSCKNLLEMAETQRTRI
ncbi:hypothetical protein, partial [Neisseria bergeri]|uniref:hypothetical protein n=1 Tax=Neisseria bergeri TaxID=1906581 RepID=UPI0027297999